MRKRFRDVCDTGYSCRRNHPRRKSCDSLSGHSSNYHGKRRDIWDAVFTNKIISNKLFFTKPTDSGVSFKQLHSSQDCGSARRTQRTSNVCIRTINNTTTTWSVATNGEGRGLDRFDGKRWRTGTQCYDKMWRHILDTEFRACREGYNARAVKLVTAVYLSESCISSNQWIDNLDHPM